MQPAFEVAEEHGHGLDALLVSEVLDPVFLDLFRRDALFPLFFGLKIQGFEFFVRELKEAAQIVYDAVWSDPSDPRKTYQNAAQALLSELCERSGITDSREYAYDM